MKNETKKNGTNGRTDDKPGPKRIHFEFASLTAKSVAIAGTFNEWQPNATPMIALGRGRWAKDLALPPGDYEYCLVVDGQWTPDPQVAETIPNPFGGVNSVRKVGNGSGLTQATQMVGQRLRSFVASGGETHPGLGGRHHKKAPRKCQ